MAVKIIKLLRERRGRVRVLFKKWRARENQKCQNKNKFAIGEGKEMEREEGRGRERKN